jgi:L-lactate dehydrogenase complex protein LldG
MTTARDRILGRLRAAQARPFARPDPRADDPGAAHAAWEARQPPIAAGDLAERFAAAQRAAGSSVVFAPAWEALPAAVTPWIGAFGIQSALTGREPRFEPLRRHLEALGVALARYERPAEAQRAELFAADLGITASAAAVAETGSIVLIPSPEEPRLLSLAPPIHLAVVERAAIVPTLADFIRTGAYQRRVPANLVFVSAASRTADIELTLALGVHGPKTLLVAVVG